MKYRIEFELPDNNTILKRIRTPLVQWAVGVYSGYTRAEPVEENKEPDIGYNTGAGYYVGENLDFGDQY